MKSFFVCPECRKIIEEEVMEMHYRLDACIGYQLLWNRYQLIKEEGIDRTPRPTIYL